MSKLTLPRIQNITTASDDINEAFDAIEVAFDNTLSRDGTAPNHMSANIDMNSRRLVNATDPVDSGASDDNERPIYAGGSKRASVIGNSTNTELVLWSRQANEPYANVFFRFRQPDGATKGFVGFTASGDNTFSITSYEDAPIKVRTGKPGDSAQGTNRAYFHGDADNSWITVLSGNDTDVGGAFVRFTRRDPSYTKGYVGYASTTNNDLGIINDVDDANVNLVTAGTGDISLQPGGTESVVAKSTGQLKLVALTSDPASPENGDIWFNSTAGKLRFRVSGVTIDLN